MSDHTYRARPLYSQSKPKDPNEALHILREAIADTGAGHDSATRAGCHPETRKEILETLLNWIRNPLEPFCWLYGPAGDGKSTVVQTLAERCAKDGSLVSSFFLSRNDPKRNDPSRLFLTIAYGLATAIPPLQDVIGHAIQKNLAVLESPIDIQFRELIEVPCRSFGDSWESTWPRLVIIDGLDECKGDDVQQQILSILSSPLQREPRFPLRFLICSRPEPTIRECFDSSILFPFNSKPKHVSLEQSGQLSQDIRLYLCDRLNEIHHNLEYDRVQFPDPWPPEGAIEQLTGMSGGQFMYASSVLDFVNDESEDPSRRLAVVLHLAPARRRDDESPFRAMDQLYQPILSATPDRRLVLTILGFILHNPLCSSIENIEELLDLPKGQVGIALRGMHSVLHIRESAVRFFYPSFVDFLNDKSRSGDCFLDSTHFQSFTVSRFVQYLNRCLPRLQRHPEEICNSNSKSESSALASVVWHQWSRFCKKVRDPTQELISALEKLDLDAIYSVLVYGAETSDQGGWYKEWQGVIGRVCETAEWLEERQPESLHLISKFRASMEGFHISFGKSSVLDDALKLLYARSLYGTEQSLVSESHREDDGTKNDPGPLEDVIKAIQTHRREEHAQSDSDVLVYDSRRECTSDTHPLTLSLSPAECSPGIFYVRTWHPPAMLISLLIDLITSTNDHTSAAFHTLFIRETTLDLAGPLLVLLPLFSGALPDIISYAAKRSLEPGVFLNFLLWLKTFPQDSEPVDNCRSEIMAIVRSIKEWILSTEGGDDPDGRNQPRYGNVRLLLSELEEDAKIEKARKKASR